MIILRCATCCDSEQQQRGTGSRLSTKTECFSDDDEKENAFK